MLLPRIIVQIFERFELQPIYMHSICQRRLINKMNICEIIICIYFDYFTYIGGISGERNDLSHEEVY